MVDISVALTWIAISAASAKGLTVFARAVASSDTEAELASFTADRGPTHETYPIEGFSHPRRNGL